MRRVLTWSERLAALKTPRSLQLVHPTAVTLKKIRLKLLRGNQREHSSKPLKYSIAERILVFKR